MKKMTKIALVFCAMLLSFGVLFGCQQEKAPAFEGVWVIEAIESEDDTIALSADEVDLFNYAVGPIASLDLNARKGYLQGVRLGHDGHVDQDR